tara:strand:- start:253 stop:453 length:201 start_codon:yes stop_codon:yes gene_type:complete
MIKKTNKNVDSNKIYAEIADLKKNLLNFKFQKSTGQLEKTSEIKKSRKKIAQLKTSINQTNGNKNA